MLLYELFKLSEGQYAIAGPVRGSELPLRGTQGDNTEIVVDLRDKRIDMDSSQGLIIKPKFSEAEQTQFITKQMGPGSMFRVAQPGGGYAQYQVVRILGNTVVATDPNDPDQTERRIEGMRYYIDAVSYTHLRAHET